MVKVAHAKVYNRESKQESGAGCSQESESERQRRESESQAVGPLLVTIPVVNSKCSSAYD